MVREMKRVASVVSMIGLSVIVLSARADETIGAGVKLKDATPIQDLYAHPEKFVGKTIRIDGVVTGVCEEMGCWMAIAPKDKQDQTVRFKVEDGGAIVFPVSAKGKNASAEGVFEKIATSDEHAMDAMKEQTAKEAKAPEFSRLYHVKATGAVVR